MSDPVQYPTCPTCECGKPCPRCAQLLKMREELTGGGQQLFDLLKDGIWDVLH